MPSHTPSERRKRRAQAQPFRRGFRGVRSAANAARKSAKRGRPRFMRSTANFHNLRKKRRG